MARGVDSGDFSLPRSSPPRAVALCPDVACAEWALAIFCFLIGFHGGGVSLVRLLIPRYCHCGCLLI